MPRASMVVWLFVAAGAILVVPYAAEPAVAAPQNVTPPNDEVDSPTGTTGSKPAVTRPDPLSAEVSALLKQTQSQTVSKPDQVKAVNALAALPSDDATWALSDMLRADDPAVAQLAANALAKREPQVVCAAVLAALGTAEHEWWHPGLQPAQREAWRTTGMIRIAGPTSSFSSAPQQKESYTLTCTTGPDAGSREEHTIWPIRCNVVTTRGETITVSRWQEMVHNYDKRGRLVSAEIACVTPGDYKVVGESESPISPEAAKRFIRVATQHDSDFKGERDIGQEKAFPRPLSDPRSRDKDGTPLIFKAPSRPDRQLIKFGLGLLSRTPEGKRQAEAWRKEYYAATPSGSESGAPAPRAPAAPAAAKPAPAASKPPAPAAPQPALRR